MRGAALVIAAAVSVCLARALDMTCADGLSVGAAAPMWTGLAACLWIALGRGPHRFAWLGWAGLLTDLTCPGRVGLGLASGLAVGYVLMWRLDCGKQTAAATTVEIGSAIACLNFVQLVADPLPPVGDGSWRAAIWIAVAGGLYSAAVSLVILRLARSTRRTRALWPRPALR